MRRTVLGAAVCLLMVGGLAGCDAPAPSAKPAKPAGGGGGPVVMGPSGPAAPQSMTPLSDAQKQAFVDHVLAIAQGQRPGQDFVDSTAVFTRTADLAEVPAAQRGGFIEGAKGGYAGNSLSMTVSSELARGGSLKFLRHSKRDGFETALFRFLRSDSGLSYIEFALPSATAANVLAAPDVYVYLNSEWLSQTSANMMLQLKAAEDPSVLGKLFRGAGLGASDASKFIALIDKSRAKDFRGVIAGYHALPEAMKQSKICMMFRYNAATQLGDEAELTAAIEELRKRLPNDPGVDFISLDYYFLRKEFGQAMRAIDNLDQRVGGDAYLDFLRGSISLSANDLDQALAAGKRAAEKEPTLPEAQVVIAKAAQAKGDFATVAAAMRTLQSMGRTTPEQIASSAEFAPFVASPEFAAWREGR